MLHIENESIQQKLFLGNFGLEKESLRITPGGHMVHTPHPFPDHKNPLCPEGIDVRDLHFAHLLLIYPAGTAVQLFSPKDQVQAAQNFKNAAHYDLKTVKIVSPAGDVYSVAEAGLRVIADLREFFRAAPAEVHAVLDFEEQKFIDPETRYAWQLRRLYADGFVAGGLALARKYQEECTNV